MRRTVQAELLDSLPVDHPAAVHSRRDLRLINRITGNHRWILGTLPGQLRPGESVLEIGAGTGELGRHLQRAGVPLDGLDLWPRPAAWPPNRSWHQSDLLSFTGFENYAALCGNLIFHHFSDAVLASLGRRLPPSIRIVVACEPARRRFYQVLFRILGPLGGANYVTRHDAHASIAAGFRGAELPLALGLTPAAWDLHCHTTALGILRLVAIRR